ncbi:MAG: trypsin-like peptidase domain-containing protein, partial [Erysipelotrichaceae bacterium]
QGSATPVNATKNNTKNATSVAKNSMDQVVEITTESSKTSTFMEQYVEQGAGSGVILSNDGYIVTNHHVINGATKISITTHNGKNYQAKVIGSDQQSDLALLKVDTKDLNPAVLGDSSKLAIGDEAIAIGNPLGQGATLTTGVISALDRDITIDGETMTLLQTNAAINPGNSGGGLFNSNGELIGIVNAKTSGNNIEGLGFAIPINSAKVVIEELMKNGYVSNRAQLGVSLIDVEDSMTAMKAGVDEVGVYISKIFNNSAADKGGLKIRDQIIQIGAAKVTTSAEARAAIHQHKAGDTITIKIIREGEKMDVKVTLDEASKSETQ